MGVIKKGLRIREDTGKEHDYEIGAIRAGRVSDNKRRMSYTARARGGSYGNRRGRAGAS